MEQPRHYSKKSSCATGSGREHHHQTSQGCTMIACVVIPNFAIAIHRRDSPALTQGALILHAAEKVYAASEHGYQAGVEVGMSIREAQLLCSGAHFVRADIEKYRGIFR